MSLLRSRVTQLSSLQQSSYDSFHFKEALSHLDVYKDQTKTFWRRDPSIKEITLFSVKEVQRNQLCSWPEENTKKETVDRWALQVYWRNNGSKPGAYISATSWHGCWEVFRCKCFNQHCKEDTVHKQTRYCALITEVNKEKRMTWCLDRIAEGDLQLSDVIWTDESSIQLESHRKITYQKKGHPVHLAGRPKHPPKIHVWGGISSRGATPIVMFTGTIHT